MQESQNTSEEQQLPAAATEQNPEGLASGILDPAPQTNETSTQPQTTNHQPPTDSMEVHKHPHHVTHKKKFGEYLLEFLMLFLAVFLGFLAENFREHQVEKEREKQYMESFVRDLKGDTTNIKDGFLDKDKRLAAIDSVFLFFEANPDAQTVPGYVINQMRRTLWDRRFRRNSTTIDQLKNAGGLRLIRNNDVRDSIAAYDLKWQRAEFWVEKYDLLQEKGKDYLHNIMNAKTAIHEYRRQNPTPFSFYYGDSVTTPIQTTSLNQYLNFLNDQKITTAQDKRAYIFIEKSAEKLMELVQKEYHLE